MRFSGGSSISRRGGVDLVRGGRGLPRRLCFVKFVCQNERTGSLGGACRVRPPPKSANAICMQFICDSLRFSLWIKVHLAIHFAQYESWFTSWLNLNRNWLCDSLRDSIWIKIHLVTHFATRIAIQLAIHFANQFESRFTFTLQFTNQSFIGLSYERPYLVLDLNLISNLHVTWRITLVNWRITLVNQQFTLVKYLISGLQVLLS